MRMPLEGSETNVDMENNMIENFTVNIAVRQGDAWSVISFNLVLDYILKKEFKMKNISI